jgi:hypothetical protein
MSLYNSGDAIGYLGEMKPTPPPELAEAFRAFTKRAVDCDVETNLRELQRLLGAAGTEAHAVVASIEKFLSSKR